VIENSIKLQKMVLEKKVNWGQIQTWANGTSYINDNELKTTQL
jgi:hypothetical protein